MAINKNFVIKNGVQVSTDLIIGDADNNKVGIGTTIPGYELHVGRGRKSRGGIGATDLVVTGVATVTNKSFIVPTPVITASVAPIPPLPPAFVAATCKV